MKLQKLHINGFGNLENIDIDFSEKINLVYGKNESGKSTLLKCITNLFYGSSKNKKGKDISDFEKYTPWKAKDFSANLTYQLDDGNSYEVFRDFTKKNPSIYNKQGEDISHQYSIDKTKGNLFFAEQTGLEEEAFLASLAVLQQEVKLGKTEQSTMIQKIANLASTGNDATSFKSAMNRLNKRLLEEVGTTRSQDRPLNQVVAKKEEVEREQKELEQTKQEQDSFILAKQQVEKEREEIEKKWYILQQWKQEKQKQEIEKQKQLVQTKVIEEQEKQIEELETQRERIKKEKANKGSKSKSKMPKRIYMFFNLLLIIGLGISAIVDFFSWITLLLLGIWIMDTLIGISVYLVKKKKQEKKKKTETQKWQQELTAIQAQIEVIQKNREEQIKQCEQTKAEEYERQKQLENKMRIQYGDRNFMQELLTCSFIELEKIEDSLNKEKEASLLQEQKMKMQEQENTKKLERLAALQEEKDYLEEQEQELKEKSESLLLAKEMMEKAYQEMQETVTPRFTDELSKAIAIISKGKYQKVKLNTQEGLVVALPSGEYKKVDLLSAGTIDQLYLALRLAILKELTTEKMPIFLDESFAYYDKERLESILTYLSLETKNQIVILTCTNREEEILKKQQIPYHKILL